MEEKTLYVSDLDGTLLDNASRVSPETAAMLNEAIAGGALFTVATARTPATVQNLLREVKMNLPAIVMTGAAQWDLAAQRFRSVTTIPEADADRIAEAFESGSLRPFTYCVSGDSFLNVYHSKVMSRREASFYEERRHLTLKRFHLGQTPARRDKVALFFATGPEKLVEETCARLREVTDCAVSWYRDVITPDTGLIDIYAPGVSKAHAVAELAKQTGATRIVVFGDNLNDLPMMRTATMGVAVENALPEVRSEATVTIGSNAAHSVARFILDDMAAQSRR
ncbi:MAG: HAD family hydrolase [[Clostridium] fimetarium]|nr:HAD family hydrolase [Alistipes timonensis]MCM1405563.1 HAD family hydrolase [[Clostridium] fimetarium]